MSDTDNHLWFFGVSVIMRFITNFTCTREEAQELLTRPWDKLSLDVETVSVENPLPLGVAIGIDGDRGFYFFNLKDSLLVEMVSKTPTILVQNGKFDISILRELGYTIQNYEDTKMVAYSAGILDNSLPDLSFSILGRDCPSVTSQWKKKDQGNIAIDHVKMGGMSIIHACNTYALWEKLPKVPLYYDIDKPCVELLMEMEKWGLLIDQVKLTEVEQATVVRTNQLEQELLQELGNINLASNPQMVKALQLKGIMGTRKTKAGKDAVSEESLRPLNHPLANKLLEWRSQMKTLTTYTPAFRTPDANGRIHTRFGHTKTGRWSSSHPNLQNITNNDLRKCIVAEEGYTFISLDASQIELRVFAVLSQDPQMLEDLKTEDLHMATAIRMFGVIEDEDQRKKRRYDAKQGNFALVYGADEDKLSEMLECSIEEALEFMAEHKAAYPVLYQWIQDRKSQAKIDGYVVNLFGRIRPIPELKAGSWKLREKGEREAINSIVQGTAVDIVKKVMLVLRKELLKPEVRFVVQVHDEILLEIPDIILDETLTVCKELSLYFPDYPFSASVGKNYGELGKVW